MTDIYLNRRNGKKKWLGGGLLLALAVLLISAWIIQKKGPADETIAPAESTPQPSPERTSTQPSVSPTLDAIRSESLDGVKSLMEEGKWLQAREEAFKLRSGLPEGLPRRPVERLLGILHTELVFSRRPMPEKTVHQVKSGDILGTIAKTYNTTPERISAINGIERNIIRIGESLQILQGDFRVEVSKSRNEMEVYFNDQFFKRYRVGTGTDSSTPTGEYVITLRMKHPVWYRPDGKRILYGDPENLLGTHYLKLNTPGIGLHGTWEPDSVGSQSSAGCVRLINEEIKELYELLPEGTPVIITD